MPHDSMGQDTWRDHALSDRASTILYGMRPLRGSILEDRLHQGTEARQFLRSGDCRCKQLGSRSLGHHDNEGRRLGPRDIGLASSICLACVRTDCWPRDLETSRPGN